jgi:hypothetical protein
MYYVVQESLTHWLIYYTPYHPRSWVVGHIDKDHEHDAESAILFVRKDGTTFGTLEAVATTSLIVEVLQRRGLR